MMGRAEYELFQRLPDIALSALAAVIASVAEPALAHAVRRRAPAVLAAGNAPRRPRAGHQREGAVARAACNAGIIIESHPSPIKAA